MYTACRSLENWQYFRQKWKNWRCEQVAWHRYNMTEMVTSRQQQKHCYMFRTISSWRRENGMEIYGNFAGQADCTRISKVPASNSLLAVTFSAKTMASILVQLQPLQRRKTLSCSIRISQMCCIDQREESSVSSWEVSISKQVRQWISQVRLDQMIWAKSRKRRMSQRILHET
jgi:hypothetical protein